MTKSKRIHVVPDGDEWAVKRENSERASAKADTKEKAEKIGRKIAKDEKGELIIHGRDGRIQDSDSYGNDPMPPRDEKH